MECGVVYIYDTQLIFLYRLLGMKTMSWIISHIVTIISRM